MSGRLAGKVALITGTAGGQGRAAAEMFAAQGAKIVGCDVKEGEHEETVAELLMQVVRWSAKLLIWAMKIK